MAVGLFGGIDPAAVPAGAGEHRAVAWYTDPERRIVGASRASLLRLAVGWTVGTVFGHRAGAGGRAVVALARSPGMAVVSALFPIPKIALVPLFIIWFGIGEGSKIATLAFGVFFPTVIATAGGVDNVPRSADPHGAELRPVTLGDRPHDRAARRAAGDPERIPRHDFHRHRAAGGSGNDRRGARDRRVRAVGGKSVRHRGDCWRASSCCRCWGWCCRG